MGFSSPIALNAAFFHDVTIFQPNRPWVKWSRLENLFARRNGGSKDVEAVIAKLKFLVTAAMAEMGFEKVRKVKIIAYDN